MEEPIDIIELAKHMNKLLFWVFMFCAAASFWHWQGIDWWAGLTGMAWVILAFVIEIIEYGEDNQPPRNRRRW